LGRGGSSYRTAALVLGRTAYRESDWMLTLFTERAGHISAIARAARNSRRRFAGSLEPLHTLELELQENRGSDVSSVIASELSLARLGLLSRLDTMEAAGRFLTWLRRTAPQGGPEPRLWALSQKVLDELNDCREHAATSPRLILSAGGLQLLQECGWGLELERCVQTGIICPPGKAAMIEARRGGLVSRKAGGSALCLSGAQRSRLLSAQQGESGALIAEDEGVAFRLVEQSLQAHAGLP